MSVFYLSFAAILFNVFRFLCKLNTPTTVILSLCVPFLTITCFDPVWRHPALEFMLSCWILGLLILIIIALGDPKTTIDKENIDVI
jgi:hypothetical protein